MVDSLVEVRWTKTAGSASDKFQETSIYNETLRIEGIQRVQGGRYYCKADNGVGVAAIKSIRVDVQYTDIEKQCVVGAPCCCLFHCPTVPVSQGP
ncbi:hypothetical protein JOQ06_008773, partial [Pogonophryne albipinna]